ncbi:MAG TPA: SMC-Scp complex subunit ScpB [Thermoanaerobaculia bacterium]|jgi:segregation and condensation protein B|nr:SMC-Scp complex subunit ScpB [Thermoanaerobaculia bacterium]
MTSREELEAAIEAVLFVATEPVASERLHALFADDDPETVEAALQAVIARYQGGAAQGLVADFAAGGVRLVTRPALQGYLRKFFQVTGRTKLSMAALETLAIVAYRQPVTGPEIQELRGVSTAGVLKTLLDHRLVRISGRKEVVGKPFLYSTSREFLVRFGLNRLQDLPPLEELEQMLQSQVEAEGDGRTSTQESLDLHRGLPDPEAELDHADLEEERRTQASDHLADEPASEIDSLASPDDLDWPDHAPDEELEDEIEPTLATLDWSEDDERLEDK